MIHCTPTAAANLDQIRERQGFRSDFGGEVVEQFGTRLMVAPEVAGEKITWPTRASGPSLSASSAVRWSRCRQHGRGVAGRIGRRPVAPSRRRRGH
jgi:hypothetical protein